MRAERSEFLFIDGTGEVPIVPFFTYPAMVGMWTSVGRKPTDSTALPPHFRSVLGSQGR